MWKPSTVKNLGPVVVAVALIAIIIFALLMCAYPAAMIGIGVKYFNDCPAQRLLPIWLIVAGSVGIMVAFFTVASSLLGVVIFKVESKVLKCCGVTLLITLVIVTILFTLFSTGWFIAGNYWVYTIQNSVDFSDTASSHYCNNTLYQFCYWTIVVSYILAGISCLLSICISCCTTLMGCCSKK